MEEQASNIILYVLTLTAFLQICCVILLVRNRKTYKYSQQLRGEVSAYLSTEADNVHKKIVASLKAGTTSKAVYPNIEKMFARMPKYNKGNSTHGKPP